jgi:rubrerythrin
MPMETIQERPTHLENLIGPIAKDEDHSINDRLEFAIEMEERAAGQYVKLAALCNNDSTKLAGVAA